jgi:hypothetical protein
MPTGTSLAADPADKERSVSTEVNRTGAVWSCRRLFWRAAMVAGLALARSSFNAASGVGESVNSRRFV